MGWNPHALLYVGAIVRLDEVVDTLYEVKYKCPACTSSHKNQHKFCAECGASLKGHPSQAWKPAVRAHFGWDENRLVELEDALISVGKEEGPSRYVIGSSLGDLDRYHKTGFVELTFESIEPKRKFVKGLLQSLGLSDRPVELILAFK